MHVDIPYVFENRTATPVRIPNCYGLFGLYLERLDDEVWVQAWTPLIPACRSPDIVIGVGETLSRTLDVSATLPGSEAGPTIDVIDPDGETYRIVWWDAYNSSGQQLDPEDRVSNAFVLRGP